MPHWVLLTTCRATFRAKVVPEIIIFLEKTFNRKKVVQYSLFLPVNGIPPSTWIAQQYSSHLISPRVLNFSHKLGSDLGCNFWRHSSPYNPSVQFHRATAFKPPSYRSIAVAQDLVVRPRKWGDIYDQIYDANREFILRNGFLRRVAGGRLQLSCASGTSF